MTPKIRSSHTVNSEYYGYFSKPMKNKVLAILPLHISSCLLRECPLSLTVSSLSTSARPSCIGLHTSIPSRKHSILEPSDSEFPTSSSLAFGSPKSVSQVDLESDSADWGIENRKGVCDPTIKCALLATVGYLTRRGIAAAIWWGKI